MMSETNKTYAERRLSRNLSVIAFLGLLLSWEPAPADGQNLEAYGADMCAELGIPADECTLSDPGGAAAAPGAITTNDKTATLAEHGRRVCAQEGVPLEDCRALPTSLRKTDETILPASSFLTVPATIPVVDPALVPAPVPVIAPLPVIADTPVPAVQRGVRYARPRVPNARAQVRPADVPLPYVARAPVGYADTPPVGYVERPPVGYVEGPPAGADFRYGEPPPFVDPGVRYAEPPLPPADVGFRDALPPDEPPLRAFRQPVEPAFRDVEPPAGGVERPERAGRQERFREVESSGRCLRAVRQSGPRSYRYVTC